MKELKIGTIDAGQRFDKYLAKCLPEASKGFLYKMLRKKNITLNGKKADGSEKIEKDDVVCLFLSDETYEKFAGKNALETPKNQTTLKRPRASLEILYEDENIVLVNKPAGMLSQKAEPKDVSLVEYITTYLLDNGSLTEEDLKTFHPGVCNRLDRNTSGIIAAGKSMYGLQTLTAAFKDRSISKYYLCLVSGTILQRQTLRGYLDKNEQSNQVTIYSEKTDEKTLPENARWIETEYIPVCSNERLTLLKVHLITGRSHQIRAHLSFIGHPLIGDRKYGNEKVNQYYKQHYGISNQMLHSYELGLKEPNLHITTPIPSSFLKVIKGEKIWEPGIPEALEALH